MPRAKKTTEEKEVKTPVKKKTSKNKKSSVTKKTTSSDDKKKAKVRPIIIDVIEDEEESIFPELPPLADFSEPAFIKEEDLLENDDFSKTKKETVKDLDQQKKFFSEIVSEIKDKKSEIDNNEDVFSSKPKNISLYRRLVWQFLFVVVAVAVVIFYFSFTKLTVTISPNGETLNDSVLVKIESVLAAENTGENKLTDFREVVQGTVKELLVNEEKVFMASGEEYVGEEIVGAVTIINTTAKNQMLVATTRLLTSDNKLFHIKEAVNVPANGQVAVEIYTEKPSPELAINPTTFTIPGLWVGLQDKIYAKSSDPFIYRQKVNKYIKASDIERAINELQAIVLAKAQAEIHKQAKDIETLYEFLGSTDFDYEVKAGEEKESFTVKASSTLITISFSKNDIYDLAGTRLNLLVPDDKRLIENDVDSASYKFENYDPKTGVVTLKLSFSGTMILKSDTDFLDKKQLVNLSSEQLDNYLNNFPEIKEYELDFFPKFIKRVPRLPERIKIVIKGLDK